MKKNSLKNIIISFDRPKDSNITGYDFLRNPPKIEGGGLLDEIAIVQEELSLHDIVEDFVETSETLSDILGEEFAYPIAGIISLSLNLFSIKLFSDEYKDILDLIKETEKGYLLNSNKIDELISQDSDMIKILDELIKQGFLRKKKSGEYVVIKNVISSISASFIQIADKK